MRILLTLVIVGSSVSLTGCGNLPYFSIMNIIPGLPGFPFLSPDDDTRVFADDDDALFIEDLSVDTYQGTCWEGTDDEDCSPEPFHQHQALINVRNDHPSDPENPIFGQAIIHSYEVNFKDNKGVQSGILPEGAAGKVGLTVRAQQEKSFRVVLISAHEQLEVGEKQLADDDGDGEPDIGNASLDFSAEVTLRVWQGDLGDENKGTPFGFGGVTVSFGSVVRCLVGTYYPEPTACPSPTP